MKPRRAWLPYAVLLAGHCLSANPIVLHAKQGGPEDLAPWKLATIAGIALGAELLSLALLLRKQPGYTTGHITKSFLLIHLLTYPTTLLLAQPLGLAAEVFPLVVEPWLFSIVSRMPVRETWPSVLRANLISFLLGLALPHVWVRLFPFVAGVGSVR